MPGIGFSLPNRGILFGAMSTDEMLELASQADACDEVASVWVGDGLVAKPRLEAVTSLAAIAARTRRVRLGVCCLATFPLRHPLVFAAQWASLDQISGGRTQLAVCLGASTERSGTAVAAELAAFGVSGSERVARLEEGIDVIRQLWSGPTDYKGRFTSFPELELVPRPVQDPCPVWIASNPDPRLLSPQRFTAAVDRVGRLADGWLSTAATPAAFGDLWRRIRESADRHGREIAGLESAMHLMVVVDDDVAHARTQAREFLNTYYAMSVSDELLDRWGAFGPADLVLDRIGQYVEVGLDQPVIRFACSDQTGQLARARSELFPALTKLGVAA